MPLTELRPGDPAQVGPYRLLNRLGSGGMGCVYLGQSPGRRLVAVKVISQELAGNPEFRLRFAREVAAARQVSGVFTAAVVDADVDAAVPWLATAFVKGPSLAEAVTAGGPLPPGQLLDVAAGLAEGLAVIHAAGVVHRDLKPGNVILAEDGPRIIDFGISRTAGDATLTRTGEVFGSLRFMSPEQAAGRDVNPASDIFSLGAVLAFAATGRAPFGGGPESAILYRIMFEPPDLDQVPGPLRTLTGHCLAKDPADRPTARQLLAEIGKCSADIAGTAEPGGRLAPPWPGRGGEHGGPSATERAAAAALRPPTSPGVRRKPGRTRLAWLFGGALVAVLAAVAGVLIAALPKPAPAPPTGLAAADTTATAVSLRWSPPGGGAAPDHYLVYQDGKPIGSVPASATGYRVTGLTPGSVHRYQVRTESGGRASGLSAALRVSIPLPPLSAAVMTGGWEGRYTVTSATAFYAPLLADPQSLVSFWSFLPGCDVGPCPVKLNGSIGNIPFTVLLTETGSSYTGSVAVPYAGCNNTTQGLPETEYLSLRITPQAAAMVSRGWAATAWSGALKVSTSPGLCAGTMMASFGSAAPTARFPAAAPVIRSVSPASASAGQTITVHGSGFGANQGSVILSDDQTGWGLPTNIAPFTIDSWSGNSVTFTVPTPSGPNSEWQAWPGSTLTVAVLSTDGGMSNYVPLAIRAAT